MANTSNCNNIENNNAENNNLPLSPPPTLEQVSPMKAQMLQTMQQNMVNMQNGQRQAPPLPLRVGLGHF
jgi:hypothetical protein